MQHWMSLWPTHGTLCRPHPWKRLHRFDHSSYYRISLQENNSVHHFYRQTDRMLTWERLAALIDEGKDIHSSEWELFLWASQGILQPRVVCSTVQAWRPTCTCSKTQTWAYSDWLLSGSLTPERTVVRWSRPLHLAQLQLKEVGDRCCSECRRCEKRKKPDGLLSASACWP